MKPTGPTNPVTRETILALEKQAKKEKAKIWKDVAMRLGKSTRIRPVVNIENLEKQCKDGDVVVVPGKLLGAGALSKKITVSALSTSEEAEKKVAKAGGKYMDLLELAKKYPDGSGIKIMA